MTVTTADRGAARVIEWDRQARRNAWDLATMTAIADAVEAASADQAVRCVVLRGAGGHFSAGDDLQAAIAADSAAWAETIEAFQRMTRVVMAAPVPAIAAVDGVCVGGALGDRGGLGRDRGRQLRYERRLVDDGRGLRGGGGPSPHRAGPRRARAGRP